MWFITFRTLAEASRTAKFCVTLPKLLTHQSIIFRRLLFKLSRKSFLKSSIGLSAVHFVNFKLIAILFLSKVFLSAKEFYFVHFFKSFFFKTGIFSTIQKHLTNIYLTVLFFLLLKRNAVYFYLFDENLPIINFFFISFILFLLILVIIVICLNWHKASSGVLPVRIEFNN